MKLRSESILFSMATGGGGGSSEKHQETDHNLGSYTNVTENKAVCISLPLFQRSISFKISNTIKEESL